MPTTESGEKVEQVFEETWKSHIEQIKPRVLERVTELRKDDENGSTALQVAQALQEYIPGKPIGGDKILPRPSWFHSTFSGFTAVSGVMALAFGFLGLLGLFSEVQKIAGPQAEQVKSVAGGFLEIAKIFAGAMVGGAAVKR